MADNSYERFRLNALRQLNLLDTPPSECLDRITRMASQLFGLPIAAVSLTDANRQWFKSRVGIEHCAIPRFKAPCGEIADCSQPLVICDLLADENYRDCLLAQNGIRFYAGAPLLTSEGYGLGAICVLGTEPRNVTENEIDSLKDMAKMVMAQIELRYAFGRIDPISGLPNRLQYIEDLQDLARDQVVDATRHLLLVDIASHDQVSEIVRVLGPAQFDELMVETANRIAQQIGPKRRAYHVAATQIAVLARPDRQEKELAAAARDWIQNLTGSASSRFVTTMSIGIASLRLGFTDPLDALRMAHSAAQDARRREGRVGIYSSAIDERHRRRFDLVNAFGGALEAKDQLRLVYQPRMDLDSGACHAVEALLRWRHPTFGHISPSEFVPMMERTALISRMTEWVLEAAMRQSAEWRSRGLTVRLAVNISAANLSQEDLPARLREVLDRHGMPPSALEIEVTESVMADDDGKGMGLLEEIATMGINVAIDDFGTGYSNLSSLQKVPAHIVKIDRSFTYDVVTDTRKRELVKAMVSLCHGFGYRVVAEGVETEETLSIVRSAGCDEAQGYLFAKPMEADVFERWASDMSDQGGVPIAAGTMPRAFRLQTRCASEQLGIQRMLPRANSVRAKRSSSTPKSA